LFCTATPRAYLFPLSLHDALPIFLRLLEGRQDRGLGLREQHQDLGALVDQGVDVRQLALAVEVGVRIADDGAAAGLDRLEHLRLDRKSTRLNSSHEWISYAVFCLQ